MTYHFVNLISWRYFALNPSHRRLLFVDSLSLAFLCRAFGYKPKRHSGVAHFLGKEPLHGAFFLTSKEVDLYKYQQLPYWESVGDVQLDCDLEEAIKSREQIVIGISSPKQDRLADLISSKFPHKEIFCLGAAIYVQPAAQKFDQLGLTWLYLLTKDRRRAQDKIQKTIVNALRIIFNSSERALFKAFLKSLMKEDISSWIPIIMRSFFCPVI